MNQNALILLFDPKKRVLLQHRSDDARRLPGYWAFFWGSIKPGESPIETVCREAQEELEYHLKEPRLIMVHQFKGREYNGTNHIFVEQYDPSQPLVLREGQGMEWFTIQETADLKIADHDREVLKFIECHLNEI